MPSRKLRKRGQSSQDSYTTLMLSRITIPLIDKAVYDQVYPSSSISSSQAKYGLSESEINNLPKPQYRLVHEYNLNDMPQKPIQYIPFKQSTSAEIDSKVEYDMDDEDAAWLGLLNDKRKELLMDSVQPETFEFLMDRLEKESRFQKKIYYEGKLIKDISDDEAVCSICTGGLSSLTNEILFCDLCNVAVHQECYGVPYVPKGQWLCRRCFHSPSQLLCCVLCPNASGAFKQTDRGFWCHIVCAIWIPEVQFSNPIFLDPICCLERIPPSRWNSNCSICKNKEIGACLRCKYRSCHIAFHASCAQLAGYAMMMKSNSTGFKKQRVLGIYCPKHTPKGESKQNIENTNNTKDLKPHVIQSLCSNVILVPYIPPEKIRKISDLVQFEKKNIFIRKLLAYWSLKRHLRKGSPMIPSKCFNLEEEEEEEEQQQQQEQEGMEINKSNNKKNNEANSSLLEHEDNLSEDQEQRKKKCQELLQFRQGLDKVRHLCKLIRKRENLKNELATIRYKCIEYQLAPLIIYLRKFTENLIELDTDNLFSKAVDGSEAVSAKPTDFVQIMSKVDSHQYSTLEEYENDFDAMVSSRITCYAKRTKIYKSAAKLKEKSRDKFIAAYKEIARMNIECNKQEEDPDDLPEPLSPQIKMEPYENPLITEFATEIDYYGFEPGPSTSSYQENTQKRKLDDIDNGSHQLICNIQNAIKEEPQEIEHIQSNIVKKTLIRNCKTPKKKKKVRKGCIDEEEESKPRSDVDIFTKISQPQSGVNRRTSVLFTKSTTKPKYKHPPSPIIKQENLYSDD